MEKRLTALEEAQFEDVDAEGALDREMVMQGSWCFSDMRFFYFYLMEKNYLSFPDTPCVPPQGGVAWSSGYGPGVRWCGSVAPFGGVSCAEFGAWDVIG
jgi:hypothetical protein